MNDVRDEAIGAVLDREAAGIGAAPVDRLPEVLRRGTSRRVARFTAICSAVTVFAGAVAWAGLMFPRERDAVPDNISEWRTFGSLQGDGWTIHAPPAWRIQETGRCQGPHLQLLGAVVTDVDFRFRNRQGAPAGCGDAYVWSGFPRDGVVFAFQPVSSSMPILTREPATPFPLRPDALAQTGAVRGGPSESYVTVWIPAEDYPVAIVRRWVGPEATTEDVAALDRLLGSLQVRGAARWTDAGATNATLHDEERGYEVTYPADWIVADENLTPWLSSPGEILSLGTFPLRVSEDPEDGLRIWDAPVAPAALADMTSDDVFVSLQETSLAGFGDRDRRPGTFGPRGCDVSILGCTPQEDPFEVAFDSWWIPFSDAGRAFYLAIAIGDDVTPELREQAWAVADSLAFAEE
jgi:hypothetical protein